MLENRHLAPSEFTRDSARYLNWRAALALTLLVGILGGGFFWLRAHQNNRIVLAQARELDNNKQTDLAIQHLEQYLAEHPDDLAAMELQATLLTKSANTLEQIEQAIQMLDKLVRRDPETDSRQETRRKLAELNVRHADLFRLSPFFRNAPELASRNLRYHLASQIAQQLIDRGANDAEAYRILGMATEGRIVPGDKKALDSAIKAYEKALKIKAGDVVAAERLARLLKDRKGDKDKADRVMEDLKNAAPDDIQVRLARYRYFSDIRDFKLARHELEKAILLDPEDSTIRLIASDLDLNQGDLKAASEQLKAIPARKWDIRVQIMRGRIDFVEEHPDAAIADWRKGLLATGGTDADLTFQLAYALLQMDRVSEAKPLIDQYRRLAGHEGEPASILLQSIMEEKSKQPGRALGELVKIHDRVGETLQEMYQIALGQCYEGLWDEPRAIDAYRRAVRTAPHSSMARLCLARLLSRSKIGEAIEVLEQGLSEVNDTRPLWLALLRARLVEQQQVFPEERRSWAFFDRTMEAALAAARDRLSFQNSPAFVTIQADRLAMAGHPEESIRRLEEAIKNVSKTPNRVPKDADLRLDLAKSLVRMNRPDEALRALERASQPDQAGDLASLRIERARLMLSLGHGQQARDLLANNLEGLPIADQPQVWKALGEYYSEQGDFKQAERAFDKWGRLLPDDITPKIAVLRLALDNHDQALAEKMVEKLKATGEARENAGKIGRAMVLLQSPTVRNAAPGSIPPALIDAETQVKSTLTDKNEGLPIAHLLLGQIKRLQNRPDEAIASYEAAWKGGEANALPPLIELLFLRNRFDDIAKLKGGATGSQLERLTAELALRSGLADQAERFIDQAIKADPEATETRFWQAKMLTRVQKFDDAEASLLALAKSQPRNIENWISLLRFQAARKRTEAAALTEAEIRRRFDADRPELLEARCAWIVGDRPRADKAFAESIRRHPEDAPGSMLAAKYYEETGRPAKAEQCLRDIVRRDPKVRGAALQLAALLSAHAKDLADWERAWAVLGPESESENLEDRMFRAQVLSRCPDPARRREAIDLLKALVADLPSNSKAASAPRDMLIKLLLQDGRTGAERASQIAGSAAGLEDNPELLVRHVQTLLLAGKWDAAEQQLDRLMAINPGDVREAKMRTYLAQNRVPPGEAIDALKKAVDTRGDRPGAEALGREAFVRLEQLGPPAEKAAEEMGRLLARRYPESSWLLARFLAHRGHIDESLTLCRTAAGAGSRDDRLAAAQIALELVGPKTPAKGNSSSLAGAVSVLETALEENPDDAGLLSGLAVLRHTQGDYREEAQLYRKALDLDPGNTAVMNNLALALSEGLDQPAEGLELINALIAREGRNPALLDTRGVILTRIGRFEEATADLEEVARLKPSGIHHYHLARAYFKAGNLESFRKVRELMRRDGLTPEGVDPIERADVASLLQK